MNQIEEISVLSDEDGNNVVALRLTEGDRLVVKTIGEFALYMIRVGACNADVVDDLQVMHSVLPKGDLSAMPKALSPEEFEALHLVPLAA